MNVKGILEKWTSVSLVLRIIVGLVIGAVLGIAVPQWTGIGSFVDSEGWWRFGAEVQNGDFPVYAQYVYCCYPGSCRQFPVSSVT